MKLIIDIDEKLVCEGFERIFTEEEQDILIRAIGHGKPYEERPTGEWVRTGREVASLDEMKALGNIPHGNFTWKKCSNCLSEEIYEMPFCPHCGADMGFPKHKGTEND